MTDVEIVSEARCVLGESPVWDEQNQRLFWVDIEMGRIHVLTENASENSWNLPERIGSLGLTTSADTLVIALESSFALFHLDSGNVDRVEMPEALAPDTRFNDGKCDRFGCFWAGTMSEAEPRTPSGSLFRLNTDFTVETMLSGIQVTNGLAWGPGDGEMYFADSPSKKILRFVAPEPGQALGEAETFVDHGTFSGVPDGSDVDQASQLWTAEWDGWRIVVHDKGGRFVRQIALPVQRPTSCCFGGSNQTTLYMTSAMMALTADQIEVQPGAGRVLAIKNAGQGIPSPRFELAESR